MSYFTTTQLERVSHQCTLNLEQYFKQGKYGFYDKEHEYVATWLNYKPILQGSNTLIEVSMVNLTKSTYIDKNKNIEKQSKLIILVPINMLHKIPFGSIWRAGRSKEKFLLEEFTVSFSSETLQYKPLNHNINHPFDYKSYVHSSEHYFFGKDENNLLIINQDNLSYIVHPLHFFMAHYGYSGEIKRILSTYSWKKILDILYINQHISEEAVILPYKLSQNDAILLWYLKYDDYASRIMRDLVSRFHNSKLQLDVKGYYTVRPWHKQNIIMEFRGIRMGDSILCCQITGINQPQGKAIKIAVAKSNRASGKLMGEKYKTISIPRKHKLEDLDIALNPVNNLHTQHVIEKLTLIGKQRQIDKIEIDKSAGDYDIKYSSFDTPEDFNVGEFQGSKGSTGIANCFYDIVNNFSNKSRLDIVCEHATRLRSEGYKVCWFTPNLGYNESDDFVLISLKEVCEALNQSYPTSALIVHIERNNRKFNVISFGENSNGSSWSSVIYEYKYCHESHKGLFEIIIELLQIGIDSEYIDSYKGKMATFIHREGKDNNWVANGLKKLI